MAFFIGFIWYCILSPIGVLLVLHFQQAPISAPHQAPRKEVPRTVRSIMTMADAARILNISENESSAGIKNAYRSAAKMRHPDRGGRNTVMVQINQAYGVFKTNNRV